MTKGPANFLTVVPLLRRHVDGVGGESILNHGVDLSPRVVWIFSVDVIV